MCGIIGHWATNALDQTDPDWCERELGRLAHRGPEGQRVLKGNNFVLGHALLSFHDDASAAQPYQSNDGDIVVVFNGEIYNYHVLRDAWCSTGGVLKTTSECELIAALWRRDGRGALGLLRGMFALAIVDQSRGALILARDYIGKKPLYFTHDQSGVHFASEAGPLQAAQTRGSLNVDALRDYFLLNAVPANCALARDIDKVSPGEVVVISDNGLTRAQYWQPASDKAPVTERDCLDGSAAHLETLLRRSVSQRLRFQDDRKAILLSGGLDSSLIAALAVQEQARDHQIACYTATFDNDDSGDLEHAALTARQLGLSHIPVYLGSEDLNAGIDRFLAPLDEPIADPSYLAIAGITGQAQGHVKAFLTGDGADDLFMGYAMYRALGTLRSVEKVDPSGQLSRRLLGVLPFGRSGRDMGPGHVAHMLVRALGVPDGLKFRAAASAFDPVELSNILLPDIAFAQADQPDGDGPEALRRVMLGDFLQSRILPKLDRGSMINGTEFRSPYLDQDVVEFAFALPLEHLLKRGKGKQILRRIAEAHLDPKLLKRKKRGFRLPMGRLLRSSLRERICDTLSPATVQRGGLFRPEAVSNLLSRHMRGEADLSKQIWSLFCLQLWQDTWGIRHVA